MAAVSMQAPPQQLSRSDLLQHELVREPASCSEHSCEESDDQAPSCGESDSQATTRLPSDGAADFQQPTDCQQPTSFAWQFGGVIWMPYIMVPSGPATDAGGAERQLISPTGSAAGATPLSEQVATPLPTTDVLAAAEAQSMSAPSTSAARWGYFPTAWAQAPAPNPAADGWGAGWPKQAWAEMHCAGDNYEQQWWPPQQPHEQALMQSEISASNMWSAPQQGSKPMSRRAARRQRQQSEQGVDAALLAEIKTWAEAGTEDTIGVAANLLLEHCLMPRISFDQEGCKVVQQVLEQASRTAAAKLAWQLQGYVAKAIKSPHANHVIQTIIKVLPPSEISFIHQELLRMGPRFARHEYGCRIYCRLLENQRGNSADKVVATIVDRALQGIDELMLDVFGHHVVESALEHGQAYQKSGVMREILAQVLTIAHNERGAFVVEKALMYGDREDVQELSSQLLTQPIEKLSTMAASWSGQHVAKTLLQKPETAQKFRERFLCHVGQALLRKTKPGRRIWQELCAMPPPSELFM